MTTCQDIIRRALRANGIVAAGKSPSGADAADALERLQSVILGLPGLLHGGFWREAAVNSAYTAREGDRCTVTAPGVVTLPTVITCDGCSRPPRDLARVQILGTAANAGLWLYSATKSAWGQADALTIEGDLPFGDEDAAGLVALLAVDIAAEYGGEAEVGQRTVVVAQTAARSFRARLKKALPTDWSRPEPCDPLEIPANASFSDYYR